MISRITLKNSVRIIDNKYVIKKNHLKDNDIFNYLKSRSFNYFPNIIKYNDGDIYYEYIEDIKEPAEQKMIDLVNLLAILHNKTTIYKEVDIDYYKAIYENTNKQIDDTYKYYNELMDNIDHEVYPSPSSYLIARNISYIYHNLNYAKANITTWYKLTQDKRQVRLATIHNNLKLAHYLKNSEPYLISWDEAKQDMPIYDLVSLYQNNYLDFDFISLFHIYLAKYPLTEAEMTLFLTLIAIPDKLKDETTEYKRVLSSRRIIDYTYKTAEILKEYRIKQEAKES